MSFEQPNPVSMNKFDVQQWWRALNALATGLSDLPIFANNAAAIAGGLIAGQFYRTGADPDVVCVVH